VTEFTRFGLNFNANMLADACQATIEEFIEDYLAEYERQNGLAVKTIPVFKTYTQVNEFRDWAGNETPVCVIVSPGLNGKAAKKGDGTYTGQFVLGVAAIVQANNRDATNKLSRAYGAVLRQLLLQQRGMQGVASGNTWEDEKYNDVPESEDRAQASAQVLFTVEVPGIVDASRGILAPSENPYELDPEAPLAKEVNIDVNEEHIHVDEEEVGP
jgi:hypothetical protein